MKEVCRGEIYYIAGSSVTGSEMGGSRPGIIVSNDVGNKYSPVVEVVYLTTKPKKPLPTHVQIFSADMASTALCEQVDTVSKDRIQNWMGMLTEREIQRVNEALGISLGLNVVDPGTNGDRESRAAIERDAYKNLVMEMTLRLRGGVLENED